MVVSSLGPILVEDGVWINDNIEPAQVTEQDLWLWKPKGSWLLCSLFCLTPPMLFGSPSSFIFMHPQGYIPIPANRQIPSNHQAPYQTVENLGLEIGGDKKTQKWLISLSLGSLWLLMKTKVIRKRIGETLKTNKEKPICQRTQEWYEGRGAIIEEDLLRTGQALRRCTASLLLRSRSPRSQAFLDKHLDFVRWSLKMGRRC